MNKLNRIIIAQLVIALFVITSPTTAQIDEQQDASEEQNADATKENDDSKTETEQFTLSKHDVPSPHRGRELPSLEINGADSPIPLGELVQLWVEPPRDIPDDLLSIHYTWTVLPQKKVVVWPDNTRILFGAGIQDTTLSVVVTASYVFGEQNEDGALTGIEQEAISKLVSVEIGDGSTPDSDSDNLPAPDLSGLPKSAYEWTARVQIDDSYSKSDMAVDAKALANSFRSIARRIQDNELTEIGEILNATRNSNDEAIAQRSRWLPWFSRMSDFLQKSYSEETISTPEEFNSTWLDIAEGLDAAHERYK